MVKEPRYWYCIVGPIPDKKIPRMGDGPPRHAVRETIEKMTGCETHRCTSSGWIGKKEAKMLQDASMQYLHETYRG